VAIRINAVISETTKLGLGMQILEIITQRMFVSVMCHANCNAHKPRKSVAPTVLMLSNQISLKCIGLVKTYRLI